MPRALNSSNYDLSHLRNLSDQFYITKRRIKREMEERVQKELQQAEATVMAEVFRAEAANVSKVAIAEATGMARQTLYRKLDEYKKARWDEKIQDPASEWDNWFQILEREGARPEWATRGSWAEYIVTILDGRKLGVAQFHAGDTAQMFLYWNVEKRTWESVEPTILSQSGDLRPVNFRNAFTPEGQNMDTTFYERLAAWANSHWPDPESRPLGTFEREDDGDAEA